MYVNKCIKCGREFETKNPKRVICPDCLYPDKKMVMSSDAPMPEQDNSQEEDQPKFYSSYSAGDGREDRPPQRDYNRPNNYNRNGNYNRNNYNRNDNRGGYNHGGGQRPFNRDNRQGGYNRGGGQRPFNRDNRQGGYNRGGRPQQHRPMKPRAPKQLLVSKEQLEQIELLYKAMLPLPNPDCHEVIGEKIGLEPRKVFFGINLVRQKLMLPKLMFPKRKLAISPDQLFAIKNLYEPLLPLPPIGCHKIIAAQLKMDEWRVHVGIGLIRLQMGLERWNQEREDAPEEFKKQKEEKPKKTKKSKEADE